MAQPNILRIGENWKESLVTWAGELRIIVNCYSRLVSNYYFISGASLVAQMVESACSVGDPGLIPGSGWSPEKETATHSSIRGCRIPWMEELGRLQSSPWGCQERHNWATSLTHLWGFQLRCSAVHGDSTAHTAEKLEEEKCYREKGGNVCFAWIANVHGCFTGWKVLEFCLYQTPIKRQ